MRTVFHEARYLNVSMMAKKSAGQVVFWVQAGKLEIALSLKSRRFKFVYVFIFSVSLSINARVPLNCIDRSVFCQPVCLFDCQLSSRVMCLPTIASRLVCLAWGMFQLTSGLICLSAWLCIVLPAFLLICPVCLAICAWNILSISKTLTVSSAWLWISLADSLHFRLSVCLAL